MNTEKKFNKIRNKELEAIIKKEASDFKYTDHIVQDPLIIGDFSIGKSTVAGSNLRRINSITTAEWNNFRKKEKKYPRWNSNKKVTKAKVNPHYIPHIIDQDIYAEPSIAKSSIPKWNPLRPHKDWSLEDLQNEQHSLNISIQQRQAVMANYNLLGNEAAAQQERIYLHSNQHSLNRINEEFRNRANEINILEEAPVDNMVFFGTGDYTSDVEESNLDLDFNEEVTQEVDYSLYLKKPVEVAEEKIISTLETHLVNFKYSWGINPAIIKAYIINNKIINSNEELEILLKSGSKIDWDNISTIVRVFNIENNKIVSKTKLIRHYKLMDLPRLEYVLQILPILVKFRVVNSKNSNNFFTTDSNNKVRNTISKLDPQELDWKIELVNISRNKTRYSTYIIIIDYPSGEVKFTFSDCKFTNNIMVGYNPPVDKTIRVGSIVRVKDNKLDKYNIKLNNNAEVISIRVNPSSKKISKDCSNRRMDIISIRLHSKEKTLNISVYAQDLKFIEHKKQEQNVNADIKKESIKTPYSSKAFQDQILEYFYATPQTNSYTTTSL